MAAWMSLKHKVEQKKPDPKEYILCSIYLKLKTGTTKLQHFWNVYLGKKESCHHNKGLDSG